MTQPERAALEADKADLQRVRRKRAGKQGYAASVAMIDEQIAAIDAQLAEPEPEPAPEAPPAEPEPAPNV